jgi:hypothetical protein
LTALSVVGGVRYAIQLAGDVDFVVTRSADPGWLANLAVTLFVAPPWWVVGGTLVVGMLLLFWHDSELHSERDVPIAAAPLPQPFRAVTSDYSGLVRQLQQENAELRERVEELSRPKQTPSTRQVEWEELTISQRETLFRLHDDYNSPVELLLTPEILFFERHAFLERIADIGNTMANFKLTAKSVGQITRLKKW